MRRIRVLAAALMLMAVTMPTAAHATTNAPAPNEALSDAAQEARAAAIGAEIRCVVCQSESINDSQADMARSMRVIVREKIRDGWSDRQVYDYMRSRYGDFVLLRPPFQANTWLLWLGPVLIICAGAFGLGRMLRGKSTPSSGTSSGIQE